jgi:CRISPR system Cascade subunit CasD
MTQWLTFRLEAPMAAFGEEPGNAARGTAAWPTKSALCGLLGAALGVLREDRGGQQALATEYRFVVRADRTGTLLRDFHTFQSLPSAKGKPATRAEALAQSENLETSITRRDYRADVAYSVALRAATEAPRWSLEALSQALRHPVFVLSLGRRSCPPGAPLDPKLVEAPTGPEALVAADNSAKPGRSRLYAAEAPDDLGPSNHHRQKRRRNDQPLDRIAWHFATRDEWVEEVG